MYIYKTHRLLSPLLYCYNINMNQLETREHTQTIARSIRGHNSHSVIRELLTGVGKIPAVPMGEYFKLLGFQANNSDLATPHRPLAFYHEGYMYQVNYRTSGQKIGVLQSSIRREQLEITKFQKEQNDHQRTKITQIAKAEITTQYTQDKDQEKGKTKYLDGDVVVTVGLSPIVLRSSEAFTGITKYFGDIFSPETSPNPLFTYI
jgi:hypothetical protein